MWCKWKPSREETWPQDWQKWGRSLGRALAASACQVCLLFLIHLHASPTFCLGSNLDSGILRNQEQQDHGHWGLYLNQDWGHNNKWKHTVERESGLFPALLVAETKDHFLIQIYPKLLWIMASETTFDPWKMVFLTRKSEKRGLISKSPLLSRFQDLHFWNHFTIFHRLGIFGSFFLD